VRPLGYPRPSLVCWLGAIFSVNSIHDIYLVHMHAIGVLEGVTLLEFEKNPEEQPSVQAPEEATEGDIVDCPDHTPCNFVKGKPRSIISLLIFEMQLKYYVIYIILLH
jgi:hypothetical protein